MVCKAAPQGLYVPGGARAAPTVHVYNMTYTSAQTPVAAYEESLFFR
jgi:hypothetical protein